MDSKTRIRFIDSAATSTVQYVRDRSYSVDPVFARQMIASGVAVPDDADADAQADERTPAARTVPRVRKAGA